MLNYTNEYFHYCTDTTVQGNLQERISQQTDNVTPTNKFTSNVTLLRKGKDFIFNIKQSY